MSKSSGYYFTPCYLELIIKDFGSTQLKLD